MDFTVPALNVGQNSITVLKRKYIRLRAAEYQCVNIMRTLVRINDFEVDHMAHHWILIRDTITPEHVSGLAGNG